jgi:hypothetical protein
MDDANSKDVTPRSHTQIDYDGRARHTEASVTQHSQSEMVDHPNHYTQGKIEVVDAINLLGLDYNEGNVLKYIARHEFKNGKEDIEKAIKYCQLMLDNYEEWYS